MIVPSRFRQTDADVRLFARVVDGNLSYPQDPFLDSIGDVRDNLHGLAQVVTATFTLLFLKLVCIHRLARQRQHIQ